MSAASQLDISPWVERSPRRAGAVALSLVALGIALDVLPPHVALLKVVCTAAGGLLFLRAVLAGQRRSGLALLGGLTSALLGLTGASAAERVLLTNVGQAEQCSVADARDSIHENPIGQSYTTHWTIDCPDGSHQLDTDQGVSIADPDGFVTMLSVPGLIDPTPRATLAGAWLEPLSVVLLLVVALVVALAAVLGPRNASHRPHAGDA